MQDFFAKTTLSRTQRGFRIYHYTRLEKIKPEYWSTKTLKNQIQKNLSSNEIEFFDEYSEISNEYLDNYLDLNLSTSLVPPHSLETRSRVISNVGQIITEQGTMNLMVGELSAARH